MLKSILIATLFLNCYVYTLNSDDICIKKVECEGNNCGLSNCNGKLGYECSRLECALNADLCEQYQDMVRYMEHKKSAKLEKAKTEQSMRGIPFLTKTLRKFEALKNNIMECAS
jgi:hypothetical protein